MPINLDDRNELQQVNKPDADHAAMRTYLEMVRNIVDGIPAMRGAREKWLPRFPRESKSNYDNRVKFATMTNVYRDVLQTIADKPFSEEVHIIDPAYETFQEDVDGMGNHITVFLYDVFFNGINSCLDWILVDFPSVDRVLSAAEEQRLGIRPYWVRIPAENMLEVMTVKVFGRERIVYARWCEDNRRVRIFDARAYYTAYENFTDVGPGIMWVSVVKDEKNEWTVDNVGTISLDEIPLVPFITGKRRGNSWQFLPALRDAVDLQVELYQKETGLKNIETLTCYPMLAANGVEPPKDEQGRPIDVPVGPNAVLYAPPNGDGSSGTWQSLEPSATSLTFILGHIEKLIDRIRELGKQPLTAQSGNITRITAAMASSKSNSTAQKWALDLKDAAERAMKLVAKWQRSTDEPEVFVFTDFPTDTDEDKSPDILLKMRADGDLSQQTIWEEMKRRSILSRDFNSDDEKQRLLDEIPTDTPTPTDVQLSSDQMNLFN